MIKQLIVLVLLFLAFGCTEHKHDDFFHTNMISYFNKLEIPLDNAVVVIINPEYCGACTDETIKKIDSIDKSMNNSVSKTIISTAKIPSKYIDIIDSSGFVTIIDTTDNLGRIGYYFQVSEAFFIRNESLEKKIVLK